MFVFKVLHLVKFKAALQLQQVTVSQNKQHIKDLRAHAPVINVELVCLDSVFLLFKF